MYIKDSMSYEKLKLEEHKKQNIEKQKAIIPESVSCVVGMLFMFVFIMSLMIVKVSSTAIYQNQTSATLRTRGIRSYNNSDIATTDTIITTTTATSIKTRARATKTPSTTTTTTTAGTQRVEITSSRSQRKSTKAPISNRTKTAKAKQLPNSKRTSWKPANFTEKKMRADAQQRARERLQMQQQMQKQHFYNQNHHDQQQQQQQQQQRQQQHLKSQAVSGEKAYLVEHAGDDADDDDDTAHEHQHEQPIYGTWRTKVRRPQSSLVSQNVAPMVMATPFNAANSSNAPLPPAPTPTTLAASAALTVADDDSNDYRKYHVYERLPRRSSTMTPIRSDLHDQIPRPPRLTSRRPSLAVRRQYHETPMNITSFRDNDQKPKPFQFPFDGPMPEEFKKAEPERAEVNNIQEILQQLHLSGKPTRATQLVMLPTGLHIAGSYKNLKASGIANFFRNKRSKKPVQLTFPVPVPMPMSMSMPVPMAMPMQMPMSMPMQLYGAFQPPLYGGLHQPYQRIAMDQFYPYKPRSPNEINLLAMQQQINANRTKNKKKKNTLGINSGIFGYTNNNSLYMQQSSQRPEHYIPHHHHAQQWLAMNATQKPKLKRIPFKLNLDIYPVLPPTKEQIPLPIRTPLAFPNPYAEYAALRYPLGPPNPIYQYAQSPYNEQAAQLYNAMRFRTTAQPPAQMPQSSNMQLSFPDQVPKYSKQLAMQQQQQQYQRPPMNPQQNSFVPMDCMDSTGTEDNGSQSFNSNSNSNPNSNPNQIMVHLNVFPKQKSLDNSPLSSTNPFYNMQSRNTMNNSPEPPIRTLDSEPMPRHIPNDNTTQQLSQSHESQRIARSDGSYNNLSDFDRPIVPIDVGEQPQPKNALISNKLDTSDISSHYDHMERRNNFRFNSNRNLEQLASEAKAASLFRFPVEDLIQFQVDDAL